MSKTAEERISELEAALKTREDQVGRVRENYNEVHRRMQEAERAAMYYRGQSESAAFSESPSDPVSHDAHESVSDPVEMSGSVESAVERAIQKMVGPRLQQVEKFATDALQQTAGREVDSALNRFRSENPETHEIMDFDRLVLMDASDEIRRRQSAGQPVEDIRSIAVDVAKQRVTDFNKQRETRSKENERRREDAKKKAMLPDIFAAAGMEEAPVSPSNKQEAGDLLDRIVNAAR
jgi:hypothetical protein|tara:strand:+ start:7035 stop:7742 length:708 start_codon:yes stop_codon:yes gene_type:complete